MEGFLRAGSLSVLVRIVFLNTNMGFAGGNLERLNQSEGIYIVLLNSDQTL
jgi:GT2 family glycosyltransferase